MNATSSDLDRANLNWRTWLGRLVRLEWILFGFTSLLILSSIAFVLTDGFLPRLDAGLDLASGRGQYDQVYLFIGAIFFTCEWLVMPFGPGRPWAVVLKAVGFLGIWSAQAIALTMIAVGSISRTVLEGHNIPLSIWCLTFIVSAPTVLVLMVPWVKRMNAERREHIATALRS